MGGVRTAAWAWVLEAMDDAVFASPAQVRSFTRTGLLRICSGRSSPRAVDVALATRSARASMPTWPTVLAEALDAWGIPLDALGLAWARAMPVVTIVPAFGLRALPGPARAVLGLAFALSIVPAVAPAASASSTPWPTLVVVAVARGIPVAIAAAVPLWAATMAGGVVDAVRGNQDAPVVPTVEGRATPLGVPLSLLASALFLATGGPARVALALAADRSVGAAPFVAATLDITSGIALAVSLGGPLLAASVVLEITSALIARAASPAQVHALLAPLRALGAIAILGLVFDRLATVLARAVP